MARRHKNQFTIYDKMEADGYFEANPANANSRDAEGASLYKGPVPYPRMLFSPTGEYRIVRPAEEISTPFGPKRLGEQKELIYKIVENEAEEQEALAAGWHRRAADSIVAGGGKAPPQSITRQVEDKDAKIRELEAQLRAATAPVVVKPPKPTPSLSGL